MIDFSAKRKPMLDVSFGFAVLYINLLGILLMSCAGSSGLTFEPTIRYCNIVVYARTEASSIPDGLCGPTPFHIAAWVSFSYSSRDSGSMQDVSQRIEIDFGDGSGWQDVTMEARRWDLMSTTSNPNMDSFTQYSYTEPGEYIIHTRVTYWDGEVVVSQPGIQEARIRVLAPESGS